MFVPLLGICELKIWRKKKFVANTRLLCDFVCAHLYFYIIVGFHWFLLIRLWEKKFSIIIVFFFLRLQILHEAKVSKKPRKQTHLRWCSLPATMLVSPLLLWLFSLGVTNLFVIFLYCEVIYSFVLFQWFLGFESSNLLLLFLDFWKFWNLILWFLTLFFARSEIV